MRCSRSHIKASLQTPLWKIEYGSRPNNNNNCYQQMYQLSPQQYGYQQPCVPQQRLTPQPPPCPAPVYQQQQQQQPCVPCQPAVVAVSECSSNTDCRQSPQKQCQQIFREKTPPPQVETCYSRDPTPEPDIIEKIIIKKCPQRIIENITQKPKKPPPRVIFRVHYEPPPPPIVRRSCMPVEPRLCRATSYGNLPSMGYQGQIQQIQPSASGTCLAMPNYVYENTNCYNPTATYQCYNGYYCYVPS